MRQFIFGLVFSLIAILALGVMGIEIFENGMRNLARIETCGWITLACLSGNLIVALVQLRKQRR